MLLHGLVDISAPNPMTAAPVFGAPGGGGETGDVEQWRSWVDWALEWVWDRFGARRGFSCHLVLEGKTEHLIEMQGRGKVWGFLTKLFEVFQALGYDLRSQRMVVFAVPNPR